jgi:hypothetical protein
MDFLTARLCAKFFSSSPVEAIYSNIFAATNIGRGVLRAAPPPNFAKSGNPQGCNETRE